VTTAAIGTTMSIEMAQGSVDDRPLGCTRVFSHRCTGRKRGKLTTTDVLATRYRAWTYYRRHPCDDIPALERRQLERSRSPKSPRLECEALEIPNTWQNSTVRV
jgi:hypothetical protein